MTVTSANIIEQIKMNFSLQDALSRYVTVDKLTQHGNKITGCCPLPDHLDRNPSWVGWGDIDFWKCFSCNRSGDQIDIVAGALGMTVADTIKMIAADLGITADTSIKARNAAKKAIRQRQQDKHKEEFGREIIRSEYRRLCSLERTIYHIIEGIQTEADLDQPQVVAALQNQAHLQDFLDRWLEADDVERLHMAIVSREVF